MLDRRSDFLFADLTSLILEQAIRVQNALGVGLYEKPYQLCLAHALTLKGRQVLQEVMLDITFEGFRVPQAYRIDLVVDQAVLVEIKAAPALHPLHRAQLTTYLRLSGKQVGLLLNFWAYPLKDRGIQRVVVDRPAC